ncbi:MAG: ferritin-like domain-containing protein [Sphingobacteriales bacterium]|nr:MAG: ferritin-like domain-containing protein [Sphingobacteriales bacterium]
MKLETLNDLFLEQLKDLYSAENQLVEAMPKMEAKASSLELKSAFKMHLAETEHHVQRLAQIFQELGMDGGGHKCKAMEGIIKEGDELMKQDADPDVMDAGLIAAAQRVEHYEISGYGTACTYAKQLGYNNALDLLKQTINEEKMADEKLSIIAESTVNLEAEH